MRFLFIVHDDVLAGIIFYSFHYVPCVLVFCNHVGVHLLCFYMYYHRCYYIPLFYLVFYETDDVVIGEQPVLQDCVG